ncbi:acyl-CoA thioesterase II [Chelativorans sp. M5D2P16]|uniref:acyl-CoA thioesterase II n=1 Tax=Chelativorans sp. M5D2P16 TaxID=3095678 RepID=UPI002ACA00F7|nr:acyl-CoA thioesterase II [Chelativorans sp. M5D2P16]MDZ5699331.1 acyl-CoA thioesterase II [Chelativorans sp. M5D2P16]
MSSAMQALLDILNLEALEHNLFRGRSPQSGWQRVFGGQVIGQALTAAQRTVAADRHVHSLHCYFMRPGDPAVPIIYEVDRIRDGGSFTTRRVVAIQHGHAIFSLSASFQIDEGGLEHQLPMPDGVPAPETLRPQREFLAAFGDRVPENIRRYWARERPLEIRPVNVEHYTTKNKLPPFQQVWLRATGPVPDDRAVQAAVLAYLSDMTLLDTATFAHGRSVFDPELQMASLDHAMWFHRPHALDDWLLYTQDSPSSGGARGLSRGSIYARDGRLIASVAQEGLVRLRKK